MAQLPEEVVGAFPSVLEIQVAWGPKLAKRIQESRALVIGGAKEIVKNRECLNAREVFERLMGLQRAVVKSVEVDGRVVADYEEDGGRVIIRFKRGVMTVAQVQAIPEWVNDLLKEK